MMSNGRVAVVCLCGLAFALLAGCGETYQRGSVEPSGFLRDYSQLEEGESGQAVLVYWSKQANLRKYNKIMMDPIVAYAKEDGHIGSLDKEDVKALLDYMDARFREELAKDYTLVSAPGPDVMRLRCALTDAGGQRVVMGTISSVMPIGMAISGVKRLITGTYTGTGTAQAEVELVDSVSGRRLAAAVDARAGEMYSGKFDRFSKWEDARDAIDHWAVQVRERLAAKRAAR